MDCLISIILILNLFCILTGYTIPFIGFLITIILIIKMLKNRMDIKIIVVIISLIIMLYNFSYSTQYFSLGLDFLNGEQCIEYIERLLEFITMMIVFGDEKCLNSIYLCFKKYKKYLLTVVILAQVIIMYKFINGSGWCERWGMKNFVGRFQLPHVFGNSLIIMVVVIELLIIENNNKKLNILYIVPIVSSFLTGARTPMLATIGIFIVIKCFNKVNKTFGQYKVKNIIIGCSFLFVVILFSMKINTILSESNIMRKFAEASSTGNISSSRFVFWDNLLTAYFNDFSVVDKLFGHGVYYSVKINYNTINSAIWSHSDFIDILISYGAIVLIIYIYIYIKYFYNLYKIKNGNKYIVIGIFFIILFVSSTNGTINYSGLGSIVCYFSILYKSMNNTRLLNVKNYS